MEAEKANFSIRFMCRMLEVSPAGYYASLKRPQSTRALEDRRLSALVVEAHQAGRGSYGTPRIQKQLRRYGVCVGKQRVRRLRKELGLSVVRKRKFVKTTDSNHSNPVAPNVLNRVFEVDAPNKAWVTDITYIETMEGWLYLAAILDLFSRTVVGWAMGADMERGLVLDALSMATANRRPPVNLIHHSDRGSQYTSGDYTAELKRSGITASMSRKGDCWDNAVAESFFSTLKKELVYQCVYKTRAEAKASIFEWIEVMYNRKRLHSTLGYLSPLEYESNYSAALRAA